MDDCPLLLLLLLSLRPLFIDLIFLSFFLILEMLTSVDFSKHFPLFQKCTDGHRTKHRHQTNNNCCSMKGGEREENRCQSFPALRKKGVNFPPGKSSTTTDDNNNDTINSFYRIESWKISSFWNVARSL